MKYFNMRKKTNAVVAMLMLILLCVFAMTSIACKTIENNDTDTDDSSIDYGTISLSLPRFNSEDGENVLLAGFNGRKIEVDFSNPEYAEELKWNVEEKFSDCVKVQDGVVVATGDFSEPTKVKITATSKHFNAELVVTVKNFEGTHKGQTLFLGAKTQRLLDKMKRRGIDGNIEKGGLMFIGDDYFDTKYFSNVFSMYDGKVANAVGICDTTATDWQYLAEKLVYPASPDYIAIHLGSNDLEEKKAEEVTQDLLNLFTQLHANLPDARIFYFGIEPKLNEDNTKANEVNAAVKEALNDNNAIVYIDSPAWCVDENGEVKLDFYRDGTYPKLENYYLYAKSLEEQNISVKQSETPAAPADLPLISEETMRENSEKMFGSVPAPGSNTRARIQFNKPLKEGSIINFTGDSRTFKWAVVTFENSARGNNYDSAWSVADNWKGDEDRLTYFLNGNLYVTLTVAYNDDRVISTDLLNELYSMFTIYGEFDNLKQPLTERTVKAINHRGYNVVAPENTLSAFSLSAEKGFKYVECDVSFTKDNVPVILHDNTVDRTSNGSGAIGSLTYEEARKLDFGSWKSTAYTGEKIPSLEEFVSLCKTLGLHAYIELKTDGTSIEQVQIAYDIVKQAEMDKNVTWISFGADLLWSMHEIDPKASIGYVVNNIDDSVIGNYYGMCGENEAFIDCNVANLNDRTISLLKTMNIPLEVWTVNSAAIIAGLDKYVSGFTSNYLDAQAVLKSLTGDRVKVALSAQSSEGGSVELSANQVFDGEKVTVKATSKGGYILSSLKVNGKEMISLVKDNEIEITVNGETKIEAEFEEISNFARITYHIGDKAEERLVKKGQEYVYFETPTKGDEGMKYYTFAGWFAEEECENEITEFVFDKDTDLYAKFDEHTYTFGVNYPAVDIDDLFGEQLVAVTDYKGELTWQKVSGDESITVDKNGKVTATAAGTAQIGLFVCGEQVATCDVTARLADKEIIDDYKGERANVYHNIFNGTRALLQSGSRYVAGAKITLKTQYRDKYQWSVSQIYKLPAENGYLFDPGWNTSWKNDVNTYTSTENAYLGIVIAVKGNANATLPTGIENELSSMFMIEGTKDSGYTALSKYIADNSLETIKVIGTKDAVTGGAVNNLRISLALKIKVGAGTKIRFNAHTKKYLFAVVELQSLENTTGSTDSGWNSTWKTAEKLNYTVKKDCYLCLTVAVPGGKTPFTEDALNMLEGMFDISYVAPAQIVE